MMDAETNYIAYYSGLVHGTRIQRLQKDHCIYYLLTDVGFLLASIVHLLLFISRVVYHTFQTTKAKMCLDKKTDGFSTQFVRIHIVC